MPRIVSLVLAGWLWSNVAQAAPTQLAGFPLSLRAPNFSNGITLADIDGSGHAAIVVVAGEGVSVIDGRGAVRAGFPVSLHDDAVDQVTLMFQSPPTVCDVDGDGQPEIWLAASNQRLFGVNLSGKTLPGFPISLDGVVKGPLTCVGAGRAHDILAVTDPGSLWRIVSDASKARRIAKVGAGAESGVALLDHAGSDAPSYVLGGGDASLYVLDAHGAQAPGFNYKMTYRSTGVPALADVDDDGALDIVVGSEDFKIHAVNQAGKALPGFPVNTGYRLYAGVCIGDLDGDGQVEVVAGSGDGKLYAVNGRGEAVAGFPLRLDGRITTSCVMADVDRDGRQEIVVTTQAGSLYVIDAAGKNLSEFPTHIGAKTEIAPAVGDVDGDGYLDIVAQARDGSVHVFSVPHADKVPQAQVAWGMVGKDAAHTGRLRPNEGRFKALSYTQPEPLTTDALHVKYTFQSVDYAAEKNTQIRWFLNGAHQANLDNHEEIAADLTQKHELWRYTLQEGNNFTAYGEHSVLTHVFAAPEIEVRNTPPTAPEMALSPKQPLTSQALQAQVTRPSVDADGDALQYHTIWLQDGKVVRQPTDITRIEPDKTSKHETWRALVLGFDGESEGPAAHAEVEIQNTAPGVPHVELAPAAPRTGDGLQVNVLTPAPDDDGDAVHYHFAYAVNGKPLDLADDANTVAAHVFHKHDDVRVHITAWDDEIPGGATDANVSVLNTPPPPPKLAIWPPHPRTRADLIMGVEAQPDDADGDAVTLKHRWFVDDKPVDKPAVVSHADTTRGQHWRLVVTPFDGEIDGAPVSAETVIENTPPTAPVFVLDHYALFTDEAVIPKVLVAAADDDGDAVRIKYQWHKDGAPVVGFAPDKAGLDAADTRKGETWQMTAVPFDGDLDGVSTQLSFKIINSVPGQPSLTLSSNEPTVEDRVAVNIVKASLDKDGDALTYRYRWLRDGVAVALPLDQNYLAPHTTHRGEHWRVEVRAFDAESEGDMAVAELQVRNHAPAPPSVAIEPNAPVTRDALVCKVKIPGTDPDADTLSYRTRWFVNDAPVVLSEGVETLPASLTFEKQTWRCEVQAFDGQEVSVIARSQDVHIANTKPGAPQVAIEPPMPHTDDDLQCALTQVSEDADFDPVTYRFNWWLESKPFTDVLPSAPQRVAASKTRRGQNWECMATPNDGKADGQSARAAVSVQNSVPTAPRVAITPDRPHPGDELSCDIATASHDADGDAVVYAYQWFKDGVAQEFASTSSKVPGRLVVLRDIWSCRATPSDDVSHGPTAASQDVAVLAPAAKPAQKR